MSRRWYAVALVVALLAAGATLAVVALRGPAPPASMDERVQRVAETVSCPDCIDLSVADSPSITARHLRATIADRLRRGWTPDRIRADLVARFGASILETPPAHGIDLLAWIAPALLVAFGLGLLGFTLLRWSRGGPSPAPPPEPLGDADRRLLERELAVAEGDVE